MIAHLAIITLQLALAQAPAPSTPPRNPQLARAIELLKSFREKEALAALEQARTWRDNTPADLAQVHLYFGLTYAELAQREKSVASFKKARLLDPSVALPADASPTVREWWVSAGGALPQDNTAAKLPPVPVETPPTPPRDVPTAANSVNVEPTPAETPPAATPTQTDTAVDTSHWARWTGVGIAGAGAATAIAAAVFAGQSSGSKHASDVAPSVGETVRLQRQATSQATTANVLFVAAGSAALVGAVFLLLGW